MHNITRDVLMNAVSCTQNSTTYSSHIDASRSTGSAAVWVTSSAGSITVTQQCSLDGVNWYDPVDASNNALGAVATTMTVGTRYVIPSTVVTKFIRFKVVENNSAATVVTLRYSFQEDNL